MSFNVKQEAGFKYIDEGKGETLLLLHGLFGALSNWESVVNEFSVHYRVVIPVMPIYEMPIKTASLDGLVSFIAKTQLIEHYRLTLGAKIFAGNRMFIDTPEALTLVTKYFKDFDYDKL